MTSLVELLDRRVAATPDSTALIAHDRSLTFAEVDQASDRAAAQLSSRSVGAGDLVGLLVERDVDTIVWMIAILKCGAGYVPLDPDYPVDRTRFVADDAGLSVIVGVTATADRIGLLDDRFVDRDAPLTEVAGTDRSVTPTSGSRAYVIYTSGSTGHPKGCEVSHGSVLAFIESALSIVPFDADDRWGFVASLCFDASVWEIWGAIATGAAGVIVPWRTLASPADFVEYMADRRIAVLTQVPSVFRYAAQAYERAGRPPLPLRYLFLGGESIDLDVVRTFLGGADSPTVINVYGPTETTVYATVKVIGAETLTGNTASPIGRPLAHVGAHVLDADRVPVAEGTTGELWLSGPSLAIGYLSREDLTRERFVNLPIGPGSTDLRCYRTGDLVRRRPGGDLEYLGREDAQVQIRGMRVELREIESALCSHPNVVDAAACVVHRSTGSMPAACVVSVGPLSVEIVESIRQHLKASLPAHMVPVRYVGVDRLPLTPSNKLDRAAVTELCAERPEGAP